MTDSNRISQNEIYEQGLLYVCSFCRIRDGRELVKLLKDVEAYLERGHSARRHPFPDMCCCNADAPIGTEICKKCGGIVLPIVADKQKLAEKIVKDLNTLWNRASTFDLCCQSFTDKQIVVVLEHLKGMNQTFKRR